MGSVTRSGGNVDDAAWSWRAARSAARAAASASSSPASRATANSAAFVAPASPMANVATGIPAGIWTIDSNESWPWRWRDGTGTPSTGTVVLAASIPGRWAAPPAPAMIARRPRSRADSAKANISSGIRWALTTLASWATPKRSRTTTAACIVDQSLAEPIRTATTGAVTARSCADVRA